MEESMKMGKPKPPLLKNVTMESWLKTQKEVMEKESRFAREFEKEFGRKMPAQVWPID